MLGYQIILLVLTLNAIAGLTDEQPIVTHNNGRILGSVMTSIKGRQFFAYRGIPFAKPPIGSLRFKPPEPVHPWTDIHDGTKDGNICPQFVNGTYLGDENCLFNYVYTPISPNNENKSELPVMVFFHIAGFAFNGPTYENYKPERFMDHDVVIVLLGFRLGPFGFLSTNDSASRGNYGLLDQTLGLEWVRDNIASFGGDPKRVTLFGSSSGGAAVTFHLFSPRSKGLFQAAVTQSGSALCPWAIQKNPRYWAKRLARLVNCPDRNSRRLVDCLNSANTKDIILAADKLQTYNFLALPFVPVVEDKKGGQFLTDLPITCLERGDFNKVPVIIGINRDEGYGLYNFYLEREDYFNPIDEEYFQRRLPKLLKNLTKHDQNLWRLAEAVKFEYYNDLDLQNQTATLQTSIEVISDPFFKSAFDILARRISSFDVPVYYYVLNYVGSGSTDKFLAGKYQVSHVDELYYFFYNFRPGNWSENDQFISDKFISWWVNFATDLNPTPSGLVRWEPTSYKQKVDYLEIYNTGYVMKNDYLTKRMQFWENYVPSLLSFYT